MACVRGKGNGTYVGDSVQEVTNPPGSSKRLLSLVWLGICFLQWTVSGMDGKFYLIGEKGLWEEKIPFLSC